MGPEILVRSSGGGAVLAGPWMLAASVALPADHVLVSGGAIDSYRWLGECVAAALRECGVAAARAIAPQKMARTRNPSEWACFGALSPWEVVAGERKIAGLAQVRRRRGILLVTGVLLEAPPWELLCRPLGFPAAEAARLEGCTTNCEAQSAGTVGAAKVRCELARQLGASLGPEAQDAVPCGLP